MSNKQIGNWIYYNSGRKIHGMPIHRKLNGKKRYVARCEVSETAEAFITYCKYTK